MLLITLELIFLLASCSLLACLNEAIRSKAWAWTVDTTETAVSGVSKLSACNLWIGSFILFCPFFQPLLLSLNFE